MTIQKILQLAQKVRLRTEMEVYLAYLLECDRLDLVAHSEREIPVEKLAKLQEAWTKIQDGVPVAYLTHEKEFYGLSFYVNEDVLVPRPETELLVEYALKGAEVLKKEGAEQVNVLELGTGSGAIAIALNKANPDLNLTATEVSEGALKVAKKNAKTLDANVNMIKADLLEGVPEQEFQIILGNLPYIGEDTNNYLSENVEKHEPGVALFGGSDGLRLYAKLFDQIKEKNWTPRYVMGEIGFSQGEPLRVLVKEKMSAYKVEVKQDYQGLDRHFILERKA